MSYSYLFSPNFIPLSLTKHVTKIISAHPYHLHSSSPFQYINNKRDFPLPAVASIPYPPVNVDYLEREFSNRGITFEGISDRCVVRMALENGSVANLMLPSGLITSYKAPMWYDGTLELLHTVVSEEENGGSVIQGGVSVAFKCENDGISWSPTTWALHQVKGNPQEYIQVELISSNPEGTVEVKHIVTLHKDILSSDIEIFNSSASSLHMMGAIISHLTVSTPEATYVVGIEGSDFFNRPPFFSNFIIVPPDYLSKRKDSDSSSLWDSTAFKELLSNWGLGNRGLERDADEELEGEEKENYKHLTEKMSKIYTNAPRNFTIIDRGRRNSVVVRRDGFNEVYIFSPGSRYEWYSKYAYICTAQSALLQPITLSPQGVWKGCQHLHNPNL